TGRTIPQMRPRSADGAMSASFPAPSRTIHRRTPVVDPCIFLMFHKRVTLIDTHCDEMTASSRGALYLPVHAPSAPKPWSCGSGPFSSRPAGNRFTSPQPYSTRMLGERILGSYLLTMRMGSCPIPLQPRLHPIAVGAFLFQLKRGQFPITPPNRIHCLPSKRCS